MSAVPHGHRWTTRSRHRTSQGMISYQFCGCGRWRVHRTTGDPGPVRQTLAVTSAGSPLDRRPVSGLLTP